MMSGPKPVYHEITQLINEMKTRIKNKEVSNDQKSIGMQR